VDGDSVGIALDETTTIDVVQRVWEAFRIDGHNDTRDQPEGVEAERIPAGLRRDSDFLAHPVFHRYHSQTEMLRYLRPRCGRDLALDRSMSPLGSCTTNRNAAVEMMPATWPELAALHPFAPPEQAAGYHELFAELEAALCEITGYDAVSLHPNAGSQGEL